MSRGDAIRPDRAAPPAFLAYQVADPPAGSGAREPRLVAVLFGLLGLSAAAVLAAPASARACVPAPAPPEPAPVTAATPPPTPPATGCATPRPTPPSTGGRQGTLPLLAADPGQPMAAAARSRLTGSKVTMTGLRLEGIVDLPTTGGTVKVLKFSMAEAVADDPLLRAPGPVRYSAGRLTLRGEVTLYATQFVGRLLGIEIRLTPDRPLPDVIPTASADSITFTDVAVDLAFLAGDLVTARPQLRLTLG
ncbi:hypothetical protein [Micromonospora sp. CPCC 205556]|uniref:hypothetical protein n=1 Tax=Micromonospora sp. CPCC 205556 TaxID=3122398 RepID=UPI002FF32548